MSAVALHVKYHICDLLLEHTPSVIEVHSPGVRTRKCRTYGQLKRRLTTLIKTNPESKAKLHLVYTRDGEHERTVFLTINRVGDVEIDHELWVKMPTSSTVRSAVFIRSGGLKPRLHKDEVEKYRIKSKD